VLHMQLRTFRKYFVELRERLMPELAHFARSDAVL
jgi:hypothetical protein